jgi:hypothetical protein
MYTFIMITRCGAESLVMNSYTAQSSFYRSSTNSTVVPQNRTRHFPRLIIHDFPNLFQQAVSVLSRLISMSGFRKFLLDFLSPYS